MNEDYEAWLRRTLEARLASLDAPAQLALIESLTAGLEAQRSVIFGAVLPGSVVSELRERLLPSLRARALDLHQRGVEPAQESRPMGIPPVGRVTLAYAAHLRPLGPDDPFVVSARLSVGGLRNIGFLPRSLWLVVLSTCGGGIFDSATGDLIARDRDYDGGARLDGVGVSEATMMGLDHRNMLPRETRDGWRLGVAHEHGLVWLTPPGDDVAAPGPRSRSISPFEEIRAAGFSDAGETLAIAEAHSLTLFRRRR